MKETRLVVTEKALRDMRTALACRRMGGNTWGLPEEAINKILNTLTEGGDEVFLRLATGDHEERYGTTAEEYEPQLDNVPDNSTGDLGQTDTNG